MVNHTYDNVERTSTRLTPNKEEANWTGDPFPYDTANTSENPNPESVNVLRECEQVQLAKAHDYQNEASSVTQADYYRRGLDTLYDEMWKKMLRIQSLIEAERETGLVAKNEPLEDSFKDLINYASFGVSWIRGKIPGQNGRGLFG